MILHHACLAPQSAIQAVSAPICRECGMAARTRSLKAPSPLKTHNFVKKVVAQFNEFEQRRVLIITSAMGHFVGGGHIKATY